MHTLIKMYVCLLTDISHRSGWAICPPCDLSMDWVLKEAPELDKKLLRYLESGEEIPVFPEWLSPLSDVACGKTADDLTQGYVAKRNDAIKYLRQALVFCYKAEFAFTHEQLVASQEAFVGVDSDVAVWDCAFKGVSREPFFRVARSIVSRITSRICWDEMIPSHGPGAVYPRWDHHERSSFNTVYDCIDELYPFYEWFDALPSFWPTPSNPRYDNLNVGGHIVTKLTAVPKDSRGPRLICVHPREAIWIQQGHRKLLEAAIANSEAGSRINFDDQTVNGKLALESSKTREYCTLDLKDASDRMSCELVKYLFGAYQYSHLACSRAEVVQLFDGRFMKLRKFAPMGNCLTFPIQSLVFYALVRAGILCRYGVNCNDVYVFGDDIIFPSRYYDGAVGALTRSGFVTNTNKTFRSGFFRESCGVDAYNGINVTPHRVKRWKLSSSSDLVSACTLAKNLRINRYEETAAFLYTLVSKRLKSMKLRTFHRSQRLRNYKRFGSDSVLTFSNDPDCQGVFEYVDWDLSRFILNDSSLRYNNDLHRYETRILLLRDRVYDLKISDRYHLQDSLLRLEKSKRSVGSRAAGLCYRMDTVQSVLKRYFTREDEVPIKFTRSEYPLPGAQKLVPGWTPILLK